MTEGVIEGDVVEIDDGIALDSDDDSVAEALLHTDVVFNNDVLEGMELGNDVADDDRDDDSILSATLGMVVSMMTLTKAHYLGQMIEVQMVKHLIHV